MCGLTGFVGAAGCAETKTLLAHAGLTDIRAVAANENPWSLRGGKPVRADRQQAA